MMETRSIRAFHYTGLADAEVQMMRSEGIQHSTPASQLMRLRALVSAGYITKPEQNRIIAESPFQTQLKARQNLFWLTSAPLPVGDAGVEPLLACWGGGEVCTKFLPEDGLKAKLRPIGKPRVGAVAVPLAATASAYAAANAVVASFAQHHGWPATDRAFDLVVRTPLPPAALIRVHSQGEPGFLSFGKTSS